MLEEEAEERLANRPKTSLDQIYKHWRCDTKSCTNYGHLCWVDFADNKHYPFDTGDAKHWVKAIWIDCASVEHPSDNLRISLVRKANSKIKTNSNVSNATSSHGNIYNHMYFNMPSPSGFYH